MAESKKISAEDVIALLEQGKRQETARREDIYSTFIESSKETGMREGDEADYSKASNPTTQAEFLKAYIGPEKQRIADTHKVGKPSEWTPEATQVLMQYFAGYVPGQVVQLIEGLAENGQFGIDTFGQNLIQLVTRTPNATTQRAYSQITDEMKPGLVKYLGLDAVVDAAKIRASELQELLETHRIGGKQGVKTILEQKGREYLK